MIIRGANVEKTAEAMKRGEWPEPDPKVVAAYEAIEETTREFDEVTEKIAQEQPDE